MAKNFTRGLNNLLGNQTDIFEQPQVSIGESKKINHDEIAKHQGVVIKDALPDILILATMGAELYQGAAGYNPHQAPVPLYLRGAEVSESKKKTLNVLN